MARGFRRFCAAMVTCVLLLAGDLVAAPAAHASARSSAMTASISTTYTHRNDSRLGSVRVDSAVEVYYDSTVYPKRIRARGLIESLPGR